MIEEEASVVEMLRDAGAVLLAKLTTGELAQGDNWFGGQTKNPWNLAQGSSGSSAGPGSATAAGCVAFGIGSETSGSILSPSARCGVTGLRPTFGRVSRYGVMALSWTQDRLGPLCRYAEDCAIVMATIARPDDRDMSVSDIPFNWNARQPIHTLRVGYLKDGFDETRDPVAKKNEEVAIAQVEKLGFRLVPVKVPEGAVDASGFSVESAVFFDELIRTGRDKQMTSPARVNGFRPARLIPAVEYLQAQRARTMMMMKLAEATADVDVYMVPANAGGGGGGRRGGSRRRTVDGTGAPVPPEREDVVVAEAVAAGVRAKCREPSLQHGESGVLSGHQCAERVHRRRHAHRAHLLCEAVRRSRGLLALAKAYQDASGFHLKHPKLDS
jgi:Asp-tRNA(Asn)/Glu-tRNA(Gln) amidotransferase A subunit family amidase